MEATELVPSADQARPGNYNKNEESQALAEQKTEAHQHISPPGQQSSTPLVEHSSVEITGLEVDIEGLKRQIQYLQNHNEGANGHIQYLQAQNYALNDQLCGARTHNDALCGEVQQHQNNLYAAAQSNKYLSKRVNELTENLELFRTLHKDTANDRTAAEIQRELDQTWYKLTAAKSESEVLTTSNKMLKGQLADAKRELQKTKKSKQKMESLLQRQIAKNDKISDLEEEMQRKEEEMEKREAGIQKQEEEIQKVQPGGMTTQMTEISQLKQSLQEREAQIHKQRSIEERLRAEQKKLAEVEKSAQKYKDQDAKNGKVISTLKYRVESLEKDVKQRNKTIGELRQDEEQYKTRLAKLEAALSTNEARLRTSEQAALARIDEVMKSQGVIVKAIGRDSLLLRKFMVDTVFRRLGDIKKDKKAANCAVDEIRKFLHTIQHATKSFVDQVRDDHVKISDLIKDIHKMVPDKANKRMETALFLKEMRTLRDDFKEQIQGEPSKGGPSILGFLEPYDFLNTGSAKLGKAPHSVTMALVSMVLSSVCLKITAIFFRMDGWWANPFRACICVCVSLLVMSLSLGDERR